MFQPHSAVKLEASTESTFSPLHSAVAPLSTASLSMVQLQSQHIK